MYYSLLSNIIMIPHSTIPEAISHFKVFFNVQRVITFDVNAPSNYLKYSEIENMF